VYCRLRSNQDHLGSNHFGNDCEILVPHGIEKFFILIVGLDYKYLGIRVKCITCKIDKLKYFRVRASTYQGLFWSILFFEYFFKNGGFVIVLAVYATIVYICTGNVLSVVVFLVIFSFCRFDKVT